MLAPIITSPVVKDIPALDASPCPSTIVSNHSGQVKLAGPSPRTSFSKSRFHVSFPDRVNHERNRRRSNESPLSRNSRIKATDLKFQSRTPSKLTDDWLSDDELSSTNLGTGLLRDPFDEIYNSWGELNDCGRQHLRTETSPLSSVGVDSPVLRSSALPSMFVSETGLTGTGLLMPFTFDGEDNVYEGDDDYTLMYPLLTEEEGDEAEVADVLEPYHPIAEGPNYMPWPTGIIHPPKKRRTTG